MVRGKNPKKPVSDTVPFEQQKWMVDALAHPMLHEVAGYVISAFEAQILSLAEDRHLSGYYDYGSEMYNWTPEERWQNVLEEIADAVVYMTSGPIRDPNAPDNAQEGEPK